MAIVSLPLYSAATSQLLVTIRRYQFTKQSPLSEAQLHWVFSNKILKHQWASSMLVSIWGKDKSNRCVLRHFLKVAIEVADRVYGWRLLQREGVEG